MLTNSSKVITNKNKIQTINWDCYLIYGLFGLWWCNCISTFQLYYCSSYTCGLHTAQRYPIIGLTMSLVQSCYCFWLSACYYQYLRYSRHTLALEKKGCPLPLDLYPYLDDSDWEDIPQKVQQTLTKACVWLRVSITCQNRLYINRGEMGGKGKPICLVSFTSFKCYRNTKMESNNLCCEKYSANFPSPKKTTKRTGLQRRFKSQAAVCVIEIQVEKNASVATVKDPSANFHASPLPSSAGMWWRLGRSLRGWSASEGLTGALVCGDGDSISLSLPLSLIQHTHSAPTPACPLAWNSEGNTKYTTYGIHKKCLTWIMGAEAKQNCEMYNKYLKEKKHNAVPMSPLSIRV